jgi:hypothetical protein
MDDKTAETKRMKLAPVMRKRVREVKGVVGSSARRGLDVNDRGRQGSVLAKRGRGKRGRKASGSHEVTLFPIFRKRARAAGPASERMG